MSTQQNSSDHAAVPAETSTDTRFAVENDCEDQGFTRISDGCQSCVIWEGDVRVKAKIEAVNGVYRCVNCGGCYGLLVEAVSDGPEANRRKQPFGTGNGPAGLAQGGALYRHNRDSAGNG